MLIFQRTENDGFEPPIHLKMYVFDIVSNLKNYDKNICWGTGIRTQAIGTKIPCTTVILCPSMLPFFPHSRQQLCTKIESYDVSRHYFVGKEGLEPSRTFRSAKF